MIAVDHEPLPTRTTSPALRWVVALLLAVVGSAGLAPSTEVDEVARVHQAVLADDHRVARRRARPRPRPVAHRRPRALAAVAARVRPLVAGIEVRRGPPRTPCVVALT